MVSVQALSASRVAVVTGSNQGIGYFIALQLAMSGKFGNVILACRDETRGQAAVAKMQRELGKNAATASASLRYEPLTLGDHDSHVQFSKKMEENFGHVDVLINNAATAFKGADPTPFAEQTKPTLDINFRGTVDFTEQMLPLVRKGTDPRIVNVSSMSGRLSQLSPQLQQTFSSPDLNMGQLQALIGKFESDVQSGTHRQNGWSNTNYGMSKLAVTAATKIWARQEPGISINCCCPGYCKTSMTSFSGQRPPEEGSQNAVIPATMENPPTGDFFSNMEVSTW
jgi:carbonyl reductase 1